MTAAVPCGPSKLHSIRKAPPPSAPHSPAVRHSRLPSIYTNSHLPSSREAPYGAELRSGCPFEAACGDAPRKGGRKERAQDAAAVLPYRAQARDGLDSGAGCIALCRSLRSYLRRGDFSGGYWGTSRGVAERGAPSAACLARRWSGKWRRKQLRHSPAAPGRGSALAAAARLRSR